MSAKNGGEAFGNGFEVFRSASESFFFLFVFLPYVKCLSRIFCRIFSENMGVAVYEFVANSADGVVEVEIAFFFLELYIEKRLKQNVAGFL